MEANQHPDWEFIVALGGPTKVAALIGSTVQRVSNWRTRGIPPKVKLERPDLFQKKVAEVA